MRLLAENWLKDAHQRFGELILHVIIGVNSDIVIENVNGILGGAEYE